MKAQESAPQDSRVLAGSEYSGHQINNAPDGIVKTSELKDESSGDRLQAARDVSGKMFQAGSIHYHEAPKAPVQVVSVPDSNRRLPILDLGISIGSVILDGGYFQFREGGEQGIVLRVRNRPGLLGEIASPARDIFAQLEFDCSIGRSTVERAYWVDRDQNQITLTGGDEAWVFVGIAKPNFLSSWHNPNNFSRRLREWNSPENHDPEDRTIPWGADGLKGQIYIISYNLRGNTTFAHKQFVLTREKWTNEFGKVNMRFID
jgi:hypothetical protein